MKQLVFLYVGTCILAMLSQQYYPASTRLRPERHFLRDRMDIFTLAIVIWMALFSGLRTSYNDTATYINGFLTAESPSLFISQGKLWDLTGNPLSLFYESIAHSITNNYHIYFLLPAFLSSIAILKLFKRYSVNPTLSLLIFFSIGTYIMYVAALKQCFAMFFLLTSIPYAEKKQYIRFYILVFIAVLFHTHAFMFAIIPFLFDKPWGKKTLVLLALTIFSMATYDKTFGAFMEYAQSIGALVAEEEVFDGHQVNVLRVAVYWLPAILALVFRRRLFSDSSRLENLFVNMSIVSGFILSIGLVEGANLYARMAAYFEIATALALPWMIKKLFTKQSAQFVTVIAVALYFVYFLYEFGVSKNFGADYSAISLWQFIQSLFS